jgi:hypothetical protein
MVDISLSTGSIKTDQVTLKHTSLRGNKGRSRGEDCKESKDSLHHGCRLFECVDCFEQSIELTDDVPSL